MFTVQNMSLLYMYICLVVKNNNEKLAPKLKLWVALTYIFANLGWEMWVGCKRIFARAINP